MYYPYASADYPTGLTLAPVVTRTGVEDQSALYLFEAKAQLTIDSEITDYDDQLLGYLRDAIAAVENYTGLSLRPQMLSVLFSGYQGGVLPYGPVWADPVVSITPARLPGSSVTLSMSGESYLSSGMFPVIQTRFTAGTVAYKAGYSRANLKQVQPDGEPVVDIGPDHVYDPYPVPDALIGAVLSHTAERFRTGGISGGQPGQYWKTLAGPYRRLD